MRSVFSATIKDSLNRAWTFHVHFLSISATNKLTQARTGHVFQFIFKSQIDILNLDSLSPPPFSPIRHVVSSSRIVYLLFSMSNL